MKIPKVELFPMSDSGYASQVHTGLFDLKAQGEIELDLIETPLIKVSERSWGDPKNRRLAYLELFDEKSGRDLKICYDLLDGPEIISLNGLAACDIYFKRSLDRDFLRNSEDEWTSDRQQLLPKVKPYGLNCPVASNYEPKLLPYQSRSSPPKLGFKGRLSRLIRGNESAFTPMVEIEPHAPVEELILFQTRLHEVDAPQHADEVHKMNQVRIDVLRTLKREFGHRFIGGFIPNPVANELCPDLLTNYRTTRKAYFELVRKCKIALFTKGIRYSIGWRLPEFLATSRCLVIEPLVYELPNPLEEDMHVLSFSNAESAVSACDRLLTDATFAQNMRAENFRYYENYVRPSALVKNTLLASVNA